jgi:hypothetical protein
VVDNRDDCLPVAARVVVDRIAVMVVDSQYSFLLMGVVKMDRMFVAVVDIQVFALMILH